MTPPVTPSVSPVSPLCAAFPAGQGCESPCPLWGGFRGGLERGSPAGACPHSVPFPWDDWKAGERPGVAAAPLASSQPPAMPTAAGFFGLSALPVVRGCSSAFLGNQGLQSRNLPIFPQFFRGCSPVRKENASCLLTNANSRSGSTRKRWSR